MQCAVHGSWAKFSPGGGTQLVASGLQLTAAQRKAGLPCLPFDDGRGIAINTRISGKIGCHEQPRDTNLIVQVFLAVRIFVKVCTTVVQCRKQAPVDTFLSLRNCN